MKRYTADEIRYLEHYYPSYGPTHCAERLGRSMSAVAAKAAKLGLSFAYKPGYTPLAQVSAEANREHSGIWARAKREGVLLLVGKRRKVALVPDVWAATVLAEAKCEREADELRAAGWLGIKEAAALLDVGFGTVQRGLQGRGYLARLQHVRQFRGTRGALALDPRALDMVRAELSNERAEAKRLTNAKSVWLDEGGNRSTSMSRNRDRPSRKVLKGGRIQTFFEDAA